MNQNQNVYVEPDSFSSTCSSIYSGAIAFFVICVLVLFPMYYRDYYFDILEAKYQFYYAIILAMLAILLLLTIIFAAIDGLEFQWEHTSGFFGKFKEGGIRNILTVSDVFLLAFLVLGIISTFQSDYFYEAFWGNEGRFTGLFLHLLYGISFLVISRLYRFKRWHLNLFLAAAMLPLLFGITDYFNMDLLHFKEEISDKDWKIFTSTLGNINTYTTFVGVIFGCISALFVAERKRIPSLLYYVGLVITTFAMIMGISDNAFLAFGIAFAVLPLFAFQSRESTKRFGIVFATFLTVLQIVAWIDDSMKGKVLALEGIFRVLTEFPGIWLAAGMVWAIVAAWYVLDWKRQDKPEDRMNQKIAAGWGMFLIFCLLAVGFVLYDANIAGNGARYGSLGKYLVFSDEWGTYRGMIWRITMESYAEQPLLHKLFGYGLDTFGLMTYSFRSETVRLCGQVFDSAHNEYLQYFVTIGPIGFAAYIGFLASVLTRIIRKAADWKYNLAIFCGVLCYLVQGVVSINLPIVTPIMWMLLSIGAANTQDTRCKYAET